MRWMPAAGLLAALALGGCGTCANLLDMSGEVSAPKVFRVYGGARLDLEEAEALRAAPPPSTPTSNSDQTEGQAPHHDDLIDQFNGPTASMGQIERLARRCYLLGVDLPLSCLADTLTLPLTATSAWEAKAGAPSGLRSGYVTQTYVSPLQASAAPDSPPTTDAPR